MGERRIIGQRTKEALAVKKAQGIRLGRPASIPEALAIRIVHMRKRGMTLQAICDELNEEDIPTARGGRLCGVPRRFAPFWPAEPLREAVVAASPRQHRYGDIADRDDRHTRPRQPPLPLQSL